MVVVDSLGRYLGEHECDPEDPHQCARLVRDAKRRAQANAFTRSHPASVIYETLVKHLTPAQLEWVHEQVPGNGLIN